MAQLEPEYTPSFARDLKRLARRHVDLHPLEEVIDLICQNDSESFEILRQRHDMHTLKGRWLGSHECHIANAGNWLLIWRTNDTTAAFQRTGSHDELFR